MKHLTPTKLLNKQSHRLDKAEALGRKACEALLRGEIDKAERFRRKSVALRGWAKRYSKALDEQIFTEFPQI